MNEHRIDLTTLSPRGSANLRFADGIAELRSERSITAYSYNLRGGSVRRNSVLLPGAVRMPFRVDLTVRLDYPSFLLLVGDGHISFASPEQDNRRIEDPAMPSGKPNQGGCAYDNTLPPDVLTDISVTYNPDEMQIRVGGGERFYSKKMAYMKDKNRSERNAEGFALALAVSKLSTLLIKSITVTEYDDRAPIERGAFAPAPPRSESAEDMKPTFESVISGLPRAIRDEVRKADGFLTALRPLRFKRTIDKSGAKVTYVASDYGLSYAFQVSGTTLSHHFGWYIVYNGKPETWHRKADYMEETLAEIAKSDPELAGRVFYALNDCVGCYGSGCLAKTLYAYDGEKRLSCHGRVLLRMCREDFDDAREFFRHANAVTGKKLSDGSLPSEKILVKSLPRSMGD